MLIAAIGDVVRKTVDELDVAGVQPVAQMISMLLVSPPALWKVRNRRAG